MLSQRLLKDMTGLCDNAVHLSKFKLHSLGLNRLGCLESGWFFA